MTIKHSYSVLACFIVAAVIASQTNGNAAGAAPLDDAAKNYQLIKIERQGPVLVARFHNPPAHTMNGAMVAELSDLLKKVEVDEQTRVLILTGSAERVFIAHYDVGEIAQATGDSSAEGTSEITVDPSGANLHAMHLALLEIEALSKPVIAAINGQAHGGGFETALACDFRYMAKGGSVGLPEVRIGIIPGGGGTQRLPRLIGVGRAMDIIMRGRVVDAETAERFGMVHRAVEPDKLLEESLALANELARISPTSLAMVKKVFREGLSLPLEEALRLEQAAFYTAARSEEAKRILQRFRRQAGTQDE